MKRRIILGIITAGGFIFSCTKNADTTSTSSTTCSGTYTYATDASPVIQSYCATSSGCHGSGSTQGPGALTTYQQVYNARAAIRSSVLSGSMPQGTTLSTTQKNAIVCWIDNGTLNN